MIKVKEYFLLAPFPWSYSFLSCFVFFSLLLQQSAEFLQRALCCPGFLHAAILWYLSVLQLFLEGDTPTMTTAPTEKVRVVLSVCAERLEMMLNENLGFLSAGSLPGSEPHQTACPEFDLTGTSRCTLLQPAETGRLPHQCLHPNPTLLTRLHLIWCFSLCFHGSSWSVNAQTWTQNWLQLCRFC